MGESGSHPARSGWDEGGQMVVCTLYPNLPPPTYSWPASNSHLHGPTPGWPQFTPLHGGGSAGGPLGMKVPLGTSPAGWEDRTQTPGIRVGSHCRGWGGWEAPSRASVSPAVKWGIGAVRQRLRGTGAHMRFLRVNENPRDLTSCPHRSSPPAGEAGPCLRAACGRGPGTSLCCRGWPAVGLCVFQPQFPQ